MALDKAAFFALSDLVREPFPCPEWPGFDGQLFVQSWSAKDRDTADAAFSRNRDTHTEPLRATIAALTLTDVDGVKVFTLADVPALSAKSGVVLDRVMSVAVRMNHLGKDETEEAVKNSAAARSDDSPSA